ncbi:MAG: hypothetical protein K0U76_05305, partial [Actinomycetia bacterium]|nr:hypothetical protein [Actinomycetes bacterium]
LPSQAFIRLPFLAWNSLWQGLFGNGQRRFGGDGRISARAGGRGSQRRTCATIGRSHRCDGTGLVP